MLQHFQFQSLFPDKRLPGWTFSFYFNGSRFEGGYNRDGKIEWTSPPPPKKDDAHLQRQIHDLMLFHVYDQNF